MSHPVHIAFALSNCGDRLHSHRSDVSSSRDLSNSSHRREKGNRSSSYRGGSESVAQQNRSVSTFYLPGSPNPPHPCSSDAASPASSSFESLDLKNSVSLPSRPPPPSSTFPLLPLPLVSSCPMYIVASSSSTPVPSMCPMVYSPSQGCFVSYPYANEMVTSPYQWLSTPIATNGVRRVTDSTGFHEEGPRGANLFVYYLPTSFDDKKLFELFHPFGTIVSTKVNNSASSYL